MRTFLRCIPTLLLNSAERENESYIMLARRPNRRDAGIHIRYKALSALNRIRIPLYKKYGRVIGVCSEMHPKLDMRYRLRIVFTVLLTYCHRIEHWLPPVVREQFTSLFLDGTRQQCCRYKPIFKIFTSIFFAKFIFSPMIVHSHSNI